MGYLTADTTPDLRLALDGIDQHRLPSLQLDLERPTTNRLNRDPSLPGHRRQPIPQSRRDPKRQHHRFFTATIGLINHDEHPQSDPVSARKPPEPMPLARQHIVRVDIYMHRSSASEGSHSKSQTATNEASPAMPEPPPTTIGPTTGKASLVLERPSRWNPAKLWDIAGYDNRRPRIARFVVTLVRPPIVSNTTPPIACELIVPPRTTLAAAGVILAAATVLIAATQAAFVAPIWLTVIIAPAAALAALTLIERAITTFAIPREHLRLQDVVAQQRGSGSLPVVLDELFRTVSRPVVLDVDETAPGVIALYERVGFNRAGRPGVKPGTITMTRSAPDNTEAESATSIAGTLPRWLWPSHIDVALGVIAAIALLALHQPGTWSRHVIVGTAAFVAVIAASTDLRLHRIPNALLAVGTLPIIWIAIGTDTTGRALTGAALMAVPLLASNLGTRGRTPGLGDVKLAALVGAALGLLNPTTAPLAALMISLMGGAIFGTIYQRRTRQRGFPLGPAIAAATLAVLIAQGLTLRGLL